MSLDDDRIGNKGTSLINLFGSLADPVGVVESASTNSMHQIVEATGSSYGYVWMGSWRQGKSGLLRRQLSLTDYSNYDCVYRD